jgi:hypothetical protein
VSRRQRIVHLFVGGVVSLVFLGMAVGGASFDEIVRHLAHAHYHLLAVAMAGGLAMTWARGVRWRYLFHPEMPAASTLASATIVGYMANNFLPLRGGDMVRVYIVRQRTRVAFWTIMATLVVERAFDIAVTLGMLIGVVILVPLPIIVRNAALVLLAVVTVVTAALIALAASPDRANRALLRPLARWTTLRARVEQWLGHFGDGVRCLRAGPHLVPLLGWTVTAWVLNIGALWITMAAADLRVPPGAALTVLVFTGLALAVPSGPGHVGTQELVVTLSLALYGVSTSQALGFAVLLRVANVVPLTVAGVVALVTGPLSWGQVTRAARDLPMTTAAP